jgi:hypothetical protein
LPDLWQLYFTGSVSAGIALSRNGFFLRQG